MIVRSNKKTLKPSLQGLSIVFTNYPYTRQISGVAMTMFGVIRIISVSSTVNRIGQLDEVKPGKWRQERAFLLHICSVHSRNRSRREIGGGFLRYGHDI